MSAEPELPCELLLWGKALHLLSPFLATDSVGVGLQKQNGASKPP